MKQARMLSRKGPITAVAVFHPTAELQARALSRFEARDVVHSLQRDSNRHTLCDLYEVARGADHHTLSRLSDHDLVSAIDDALEHGRIMFLEGWDFGRQRASDSLATTVVSVVLKAIMGDRVDLEFEGRRYRIVDASRALGRDVRDAYRPVGSFEVQRLVRRMAASIPSTPEEREQWAKAVRFVCEPTRDGALKILHYSLRGGGAAPILDEPAVTPSQLRPRTAVEDWIELEVVYDDGVAFAGDCSVELPGGRVSDGPPDERGIVRIDGLSSGSCKLRFPDTQVESPAVA